MPTWAFKTEGVPDKAIAACSPLPSTNPIASSWGLVHVAGSPSTTRIPSPRPQSTRGRGVLGTAGSTKGDDSAQPSSWSPDYILPSLYVARPTPQCVPWESNNEIPIPAVAPNSPTAPYSTAVNSRGPNPAIAQRSWHIGGRRVTAWPKVNLTWPTFSGGQG